MCAASAFKNLISGFSYLGYIIFLLLHITHANKGLVFSDDPVIVYVILSQQNAYHEKQAESAKNDIILQYSELESIQPSIYLLHEQWPQTGSWTVFPILEDLCRSHCSNASWFFFGEENTHVKVFKLKELLNNFNYSQDLFLGHALTDREASIIHHFAFHDSPYSFSYPNFANGFLFSMSLLKRLAKKWKEDPRHLDFSVDPKHELALYIRDKLHLNLTHTSNLCIYQDSECATFYSSWLPSCGPPVPKSKIYFAVKTCGKFHNDRVPVVKNTWGKHTENIKFFSDEYDPEVPTINLGIPNTEKGHCAKTLSILSYISKDKDFKYSPWIMITDDDTILSVSRLQKLLCCYDQKEAIALGERYGYSVTSDYGYNYITGGGGMVFSMVAVKKIVNSGHCICPSNDTPDDMFLGICFKHLGINIIHSQLFHQARPNDYSTDYLNFEEPVSFHKHWMLDPVQVYLDWFFDSDVQGSHIGHQEL